LAASIILSASLVLLVGCDKVDDGDTSGGDADTTGDGDGDTGDGDGDTGDGDGDPMMCPDPFPSFDKACADVGECTIVFHQTDCCGSMSAFGIAATEQAAFGAVEMICRSQYPECGCAPGPTTAEDGNSSEDIAAIIVECVAGSCATSIP
jgi:hypothetical protein